VTLYIAKEDGPQRRTLHISGRLAADGAGELETVCGDPARLVIDLSELLSADETGTRLLVEVRDAGAQLVAVPPFIQLLLRARSGENVEIPGSHQRTTR
jgi:hypothetical protein